MSNIKSVFIAPLTLKVSYDNSVQELTQERASDEELEKNMQILGAYDPNCHTIFIGNNLNEENKIRTLTHEIVEGINEICELDLDNHTKIVALENAILGLVLNNKELITRIQEVLGKKERKQKSRGSKNKNI